jgi:hypothetical protein
MTLRDITCLSLIAGSLAAALLTMSNRSAGQQPANPTQPPGVVRSHFQTSIDALAAKWHIAVVAESGPIKEKAGADLSAPLPNETVDQAVNRVATAFDYAVARTSNVFVLTKKYTDPEDLPDITLLEAADALDASLGILILPGRNLPAEIRSVRSRAQAISFALSHEQLLALPRPGVPVSSLSPEQRQEALRLATWLFHKPMTPIENKLRKEVAAVRSLTASDPELHWSHSADGGAKTDEFGFDLTDGRNSQFLSFSRPKAAFSGFADSVTRFEQKDEDEPAKNAVTVGAPDAAAAESINRSGDRIQTLSDVSSLLNGRSNPIVTVSTALGAKTISTAGLTNVDAKQVVSAIAEVYGLDARRLESRVTYIARATIPIQVDPAQIKNSLVASMPRLVFRFLAARMKALTLPSGFKEKMPDHGADFYRTFAFNAYRVALDRITSIAEPLDEWAKDRQVRLSYLPGPGAALFAFAQSIVGLSTAMWLSSLDLPLYIRDFDHATLAGVYMQTGADASLTIRFLNTDPVSGILVSSPEIVEGRVPPR